MRLSLKHLAPVPGVAVALVASLAFASAAAAQPAFSKSFNPSTIGPGSASELVFTITNNSAAPVTDLAFTDVLPAAVTLASPSGATTNCVGATLSAPAGGTTITLSDGDLGAMSSCTVRVFTTSGTPGTHMNVSGDLTSSAGNSGTASADLTVEEDRPGISKSFSPSTIPLDGVSTLTFVVDNTLNEGAETFTIVDDFPAGVTVASPVMTSNSCGGGFSPPPSAGDDGFLFVGTLGGMSTCTFSVEVTGAIPGTALNRTSEAVLQSGGTLGIAVAALEVEPPGFLVKRFTDDPVAPGGTVTLEFTLTNFDRLNSATGITFTDDLDAALSGLSAVALPATPCGAGSTLTGTTTLTLANGTLAPEASCTFSATLQVPGGAAGGVYVNTTSAVTVDYGAGPVMEDPASDRLIVSNAPLLSKEFIPNPGAAGASGQVLRFTLDNSASAQAASDVNFSDNLGSLPLVLTSLPSLNFCGAGSFVTLDLGVVRFFDMSLAAGDSCTFDVGYSLPLNASPGDYPNLTSQVNATVGGESTAGPPASDVLTVLAAPRLRKEFVGDPALPGDLVDLVFTLSLDAGAPGGATDVAFTDDLDAALSGLTAVGTPVVACGGTLTGTSTLSFSGGSLVPDQTCSFSVQVLVPLTAPPGSFTNTTSDVTATMLGTAVASPAASDDLVVSTLTLDKEFIDDPTVPGADVTLRFTITNASLTGTATGLFFTDQVDASLPGLAATDTPQMNVCGAGSSLSGTTTLVFTGGMVGPASSCTFDVTLAVPAGATPGFYPNFTSQMSGQFDGTPVTVPPGQDQLQVVGALEIDKEFLDDPVAPGDTVTLRFTLSNQNPANAASSVAFTDDLDANLPGLAAVGLPMAGCGGTLSGTTDLTFSGGAIAAGSSCFFDVTVQVPAAASFGSYLNTTSTVTGDVGGVAVEGDPARDRLTVSEGPAIAKSFSGPALVGGTVDLEFTVTNTSPTQTATNVAFSDDLDAFLPGVTATPPADGSCGPGSTFTVSPVQTLSLTGGTLAPGASCVFTVGLQLPAMAAPGTYTNTSGAVSATLGGTPQSGNAATDDLLVLAPPLLTKTFLDNPVTAGGTSTLEFTVVNPNPATALGALSVSDDLGAALPGLASVSPPQNDACGAGSMVAGGSVVSLSGGSLPAAASCTFSVVVQVPGGVPLGTTADNVTTAPTATAAGVMLSGEPATDVLRIGSFAFSKSFSGPTPAGQPVLLTFTITNLDMMNAASDLGFSDDLGAVVPGLEAVDLPQSDVCGAGSTLTGTSVITLAGGQLAPGATCSFTVTVLVPVGTPAGSYANATSDLGQGAAPVAAPAEDDLVVVDALAAIPTLDVWGLAALVALLAFVAWRRLRRVPSV